MPTAPSDASSTLGVERVVDVGARVQETVDGLIPHIDEASSAREFVSLSGNPRGDIYGGPSAYPLYDYKRADPDGEIAAGGEITEAIDLADLDRLREEHGVDAAVVNPTLNRGLAEVNNDRFAVALASAYNDWLVSGLDDHDALVGNLVVAPQHPERAVEEIDRVADEASIAGLHLPITGIRPPAGHRSYRPIYEAAEAHGLPVTMEPTVGLSSFHGQFFDADYFAYDYAYHAPFLLMRHLTSIAFEGIPARYPDLDFVVLGCGLGWAPYTIMRLDDHYLELGYEIPALSKLPSEYFADCVYWGTAPVHDPGTHPDETYLPRMLEMVGPGNAVFASDLPHPVTDSPGQVYDVLAPDVGDDVLDAVFGGTAADVFDL